MESSYNEREAVRAHIVRAVTLILDTSEEAVLCRLRTVACDAVRDDMGYPSPGRDAFEQALRGGDREGYVRAVGRAVCTELEEIIEELRTPDTNGDDLLYRLLIDLINLSDSRQADHFGEHYLPEDADDIEWEDEDEQDDEDDLGDDTAWKAAPGAWKVDGSYDNDPSNPIRQTNDSNDPVGYNDGPGRLALDET